MSFLSSALNSIKTFYSEINGATLTGAIDVVVVEQKDGSFHSSPFHVRFGKLGVLKAKEKVVDIEINGEPVDIHMKLDDAGTAFFVDKLNESEDEDDFPEHLATSPLPESELEQTPPPVETTIIKEEIVINPSTTPVAEVDQSLIGGEINRKGKLNRKKRKRRQKHSRNGSKSSLKEIIVEGSMNPEGSDIFAMDDVNDADDDEDDESPSTITNNSTSLSTSIAEIDNSFLGSRIPRSISENEKLEAVLKDDLAATPRAATSMAADYNYFSEPENGTSPMTSRPRTPVLSDTEYEMNKSKLEAESDKVQSWKWGELPSSEAPLEKKEGSAESADKDADAKAQEAAKKWSVFNYFSSKNNNANKDVKGVFLDDLKDGDAEMMEIYLGKTRSGVVSDPINEDAESGNGASLPMSPNSVEGAIGGKRLGSMEDMFSPDVAFSLCGGLDDPSKQFSPLLFEQSMISYDDFVLKIQNNSNIYEDPNLVVRIDDNYLMWKEARNAVMSWVLFKRPLPEDVTVSREMKYAREEEVQPTNNTQKSGGLTSWFGWGGKKSVSKQPDEISSAMASGLEEELVKLSQTSSSQLSEIKATKAQESTDSSDSSSSPKANKSSNKFNRRVKDKFKKTLRLSSDDVKCLNLRFGSNEAEFSVTTAYQGTTRCKCHIYLWKHTDKIVISDIDGTITKSDLLGHIMPIIGGDWAQSGVAALFSKIRSNGYHIVYLSARAIGQASLTKEYLQSIKQGALSLPDGPLLLNPTSLVSALHREVIEKKPEEFKISCLRDIQHLFDEDKNPFYAGYGNRINDTWAYRAVGIPISRIFTINYKGEIKHEYSKTFQTSYGNQSSIVDHLFPPRNDEIDSPTTTQDYSSFTYWREPIAEFEVLPEEPLPANSSSANKEEDVSKKKKCHFSHN